MNESISISDITADEVLAILRSWEIGHLAREDVQLWAEGIYEATNWQSYLDEVGDSALSAVVRTLNWIYLEKVTQDDIPILRDLLMNYGDSPERALVLHAEFVKSKEQTQY